MRIIVRPNPLQEHYNHGQQLHLPASKAEILDVLDRAQVPYGSGDYEILPRASSHEFVVKILINPQSNPSISEMNLLAECLEQLEDYECDMVSGILEIRGSYNIADAINATYNLDRYTLIDVASNDYTLGEVAIANDLLPSIEQVPDELLDCLDM